VLAALPLLDWPSISPYRGSLMPATKENSHLILANGSSVLNNCSCRESRLLSSKFPNNAP
jgi:hypothetical protein